jgi:type IV pilus assembly protein PilB
LGFAETLRAALRQDPDDILIGRIRDEETASIAVKSSLTGHLVLSTLSSNGTVTAIKRLLNLGI